MKKLIFVTGCFPFGSGETFIEHEIKILSEYFDQIIIYAVQVSDGDKLIARNIPDNCKVIRACATTITPWSYLHSLGAYKVWRELKHFWYRYNAIRIFKNCCYNNELITNSSQHLTLLLDELSYKPDDQIFIYSYWLHTMASIAVRIREILYKKGILSACIARTHGFDLYSEVSYVGYVPFQRDVISKLDAVYACSDHGKVYLKQKYPDLSNKIHCRYLGVLDYFEGIYPSLAPENKERLIVSCSNVIPVKRVHLIINALSKIEDIRIKWVHFGDGELLPELVRSAENLPSNITVEFPGRLPNMEIIRFYLNHNVNLFVNTSLSEGLPVSMMEAASCGIPIVATAVGGTPEIVQHDINGYTVPKDCDAETLMQSIESILTLPISKYDLMCQNSRRLYEEHFNATKNYQNFCQEFVLRTPVSVS